jgi:CheY-like chemotaxis protein
VIRSGESLEYTVSDTGIGIGKEWLDNIFDKFTQVDSSYTKKYQGTGLGLSIVKELVDLLEGTIQVRSEVGQGSSFTVRLPFKAAQSQEDREAVADFDRDRQLRMLKGLKIMIVEDNTINGLMTKITLEKFGIKTIVCPNGKIALEQLGKNAFDLILMDIQMPEMNGMECVKIIRGKGLTVPVIALTGYSDREELKQFLESGFSDCLVKPLSERSLINRISRFLKSG